MEHLLSQLLSFPPHPPPADSLSDAEYDKQIKALLHTLASVSTSKLTGGVRGGGDLLDVIDPSINTLPYLHVLLAHISANNGKAANRGPATSSSFAPNEPLWHKMVKFMEQFDPVQIRYDGPELRRLIDLTALRAEKLQQPSAAIAPVRTAILRLDPSGATFTSSHLKLASLCLQTHEFASALPVLDKDISFIPSTSALKDDPPVNTLSPFLCSRHESSTGYINFASGISDRLKYEDYLLYHLYGAMIYIALKDWERALFFLEIVIASPTARDNSAATSRIQVEAYKKWVLVGLLHKGHIPRTPKNISMQTTKTYQGLCKAYTNLAEVFKDSIRNEESDRRLIAEARYALSGWQEDYNEGLVKQVVRAYRQFSVQHLEQTYRALPVSDVTRRTSPDPTDFAETANYLMDLITRGLLNATVSDGSSEDPASWVLRFNSFTGDDTSVKSEGKQYDALRKQIVKVTALTDHVREADRQLGLSKDYIQDAKKNKLAKENGLAEDHAVQSALLDQDFFAHDEDMMEDVV